MERMALKKDIVDRIKTDPILFGAVASALGASPFTLPRILKRNDEKLTQFSVLNAIKKHCGECEDNALLEYVQQEEPKSTAA